MNTWHGGQDLHGYWGLVLSDTWAEKASLTGCGASCLVNQGADWQEAQNWEVGKEEMELFCDLGKGGVYYFSDKHVYRHNMTGD